MPTTDDAAFEFLAFGVGIGIEVEHRCADRMCEAPDLAERVRDLLPPGWKERSPTVPARARFDLECRGDHVVLHGSDHGPPANISAGTEEGLHRLDGAVRSVVAEHAPGLVFIHAGVIAFAGRALVLPGRSMAGKTTLVAGLVRAGALYLSDEYAVVDAAGTVHPYPRRLSMRGLQRRDVPVEDLGGRAGADALPIGTVAALRYRAGARWSVGADGPGSCALALADNAIAAQSRPIEVLSAAAMVARSARFVAGERGEVDDAVQRLVDLVGADA